MELLWMDGDEVVAIVARVDSPDDGESYSDV